MLEILPRYALKEGVVAIGELGYDEQAALEDKYFRLQLELAKELAAAGDDPHAPSRQTTGYASVDGRGPRAQARSELRGDRSQ